MRAYLVLAAVSFTAAAILPGPGAAETRCRWLMGEWVCSDPRKPVDFMGAIKAGQDAAGSSQGRQDQSAQREQLRDQREAMARERENHDLRRKVGGMVGEGNCQDAKAAALRAGDFDLAKQVQELCVPSSPEAP